MGRHNNGTMGFCPRGMHIRVLSKHHVFPKRFFGNGNGNRSLLLLCLECHEEIERIIPYSFRLSKEQYVELHRYFIRGESFNELSDRVRRYKKKKTNYKNNRATVLLKITTPHKKTNGGNQFVQKQKKRKLNQKVLQQHF